MLHQCWISSIQPISKMQHCSFTISVKLIFFILVKVKIAFCFSIVLDEKQCVSPFNTLSQQAREKFAVLRCKKLTNFWLAEQRALHHGVNHYSACNDDIE